MISAVVIVTHEHPDEALACVDSVFDSDADDFGLILVDNCSDPLALRTLLHGLNPRLLSPLTWSGQRGDVLEGRPVAGRCTYLAVASASVNRGYAAGNNAGVKLARARGARFAWILNDDTIVDTRALRLLEKRARLHPDVGAIGSLVLEYGRRDVVQCIGGARFHPGTTRNRYIARGTIRDDAVERESEYLRPHYISGAAMYCPITAFARVGGLCEDYVAFYEELDYCERLKRAGYAIAVERKAVVWHKGGTTLGSPATLKSKPKITAYYGTRSAILFVRRYYPWLLPLAALVRFAYAIALCFTSRPAGFAALRGLGEGVRGGPAPVRFSNG